MSVGSLSEYENCYLRSSHDSNHTIGKGREHYEPGWHHARMQQQFCERLDLSLLWCREWSIYVLTWYGSDPKEASMNRSWNFESCSSTIILNFSSKASWSYFGWRQLSEGLIKVALGASNMDFNTPKNSLRQSLIDIRRRPSIMAASLKWSEFVSIYAFTSMFQYYQTYPPVDAPAI